MAGQSSSRGQKRSGNTSGQAGSRQRRCKDAHATLAIDVPDPEAGVAMDRIAEAVSAPDPKATAATAGAVDSDIATDIALGADIAVDVSPDETGISTPSDEVVAPPRRSSSHVVLVPGSRANDHSDGPAVMRVGQRRQSEQVPSQSKRKLRRLECPEPGKHENNLVTPCGPPRVLEPLSEAIDNPVAMSEPWTLAIWRPLPPMVEAILRAPLAPIPLAPALPPLPLVPAGVYSARTGIANIEHAKSGTSVCILCGVRIDKGAARFLYWWKLRGKKSMVNNFDCKK